MYHPFFLPFGLAIAKQPLICFLSFYICLCFLEFYINGASYTVYTVFCLVFHSAQLFWDSSCHCKYQYLIPLHCWVEFLCMSLPHLFRHSPVDDYLGHFHFFPIINTTAINIYIHVFSWTYAFISFGNIPRIKMLDHMRRVCLYFHKTAKLFSEVIV